MKLFNCYFCGSSVTLEEYKERHHPNGVVSSIGWGGKYADTDGVVVTSWYVHCHGCGASGPEMDDRLKTIKNWNAVGKKLMAALSPQPRDNQQ